MNDGSRHMIIIKKRIKEVDLDHARNEVLPFIWNPKSIALCMNDFFMKSTHK